MPGINTTIKKRTNTPKYEWFCRERMEKNEAQRRIDEQDQLENKVRKELGCHPSSPEHLRCKWAAFVEEFNEVLKSIPHNLDGHFWVVNPSLPNGAKDKVIDPWFSIYEKIQKINKLSPRAIYFPCEDLDFKKRQIEKHIAPLHACIKKHKLKRKDIVNNPLFKPYAYGCNFNALMLYIKHAKEGYVIDYGSLGWRRRHDRSSIHWEFEDPDLILRGITRWPEEEYVKEFPGRNYKFDCKYLEMCKLGKKDFSQEEWDSSVSK
jgi:hypothetical protein